MLELSPSHMFYRALGMAVRGCAYKKQCALVFRDFLHFLDSCSIRAPCFWCTLKPDEDPTHYWRRVD